MSAAAYMHVDSLTTRPENATSKTCKPSLRYYLIPMVPALWRMNSELMMFEGGPALSLENSTLT